MAALEEEARAAGEKKRQAMRQREVELGGEGGKRRGGGRRERWEKPAGKAQRNFTDPDSRMMRDGATKSFEQSYDCQAVVEESQVIVAAGVTQHANDQQQVKPMVERIKENTEGRMSEKMSQDSGCCSKRNVEYLDGEGIDAYIAVGWQKHGERELPAPRGRIGKDATVKERMARKLRTKKGRASYKKRKQMVEPVFGQIKEVRSFRRFLLRGLEAVTAEWALVCLTHNLLKLFRSGFSPGIC